jgi:hypothetical protein
MRPFSSHLAGVIIGFILALTITPTSWVLAENGRDFAGALSVTDVVGATDNVNVTLTLEIFNFSGADVMTATIRIEDHQSTNLLYEFPMIVDMAYRETALVTEPVLVVPRQEYEKWWIGTLPRVTVHYIDATDNPRSSYVELVSNVMEEEVQP